MIYILFYICAVFCTYFVFKSTFPNEDGYDENWEPIEIDDTAYKASNIFFALLWPIFLPLLALYLILLLIKKWAF